MRSTERLKAHYEIEKRLASQLRSASCEERPSLYLKLYDELYNSVPDHPQLTTTTSKSDTEWQLRFLRKFVNPDMRLVEIGAGDCEVSRGIAPYVNKVYAIDASDATDKKKHFPHNMVKLIADGTKIDLPSECIDIVYSDQLLEHLHPDDAILQSKEIFRILRYGGKYFCFTPNRINGPHDISRYFDDIATGFHLKEYSYSEIYALFKDTGFRKIDAFIGHKHIQTKTSIKILMLFESAMCLLPLRLRQIKYLIPIFGMKVITEK